MTFVLVRAAGRKGGSAAARTETTSSPRPRSFYAARARQRDRYVGSVVVVRTHAEVRRVEGGGERKAV